MALGSYKVWAPLAVVLAITISMHRRSFQAISSTAMDALNELPFVPSRMDNSHLLGASDTVATADKPKEGKIDEPKKIEKPLNVVVMYGDDWRHDAIVSESVRCSIVHIYTYVCFCLLSR
jgi:hypothetical protein